MADVITTNRFTLPNPSPIGPREVPIYDVFHCRDRYIGLVGPYYSRAAFQNVEIRCDGDRLPLYILPDTRMFTMAVLAKLPKRWLLSDSWLVEIRTPQDAFGYVIKRQPNSTVGVSLSTLTRHDTAYLDEWLHYHRRLGIEHFYIYNNSESAVSRILAPQADVTEIPWPGEYELQDARLEPFWGHKSHLYLQPPQMIHACLRFGNCEWMGFFDPDEFLCPMQSTPLGLILADADYGSFSELVYQPTAAIRIQGKWFGTSGHQSLKTPVLDNYTHCEKGHTCGTKCFVRPEKVNASAVHYFEVEGQTAWVPDNVLRFNHYRSISSYKARVGPQFDRDYTNETTDTRIIEVRNAVCRS